MKNNREIILRIDSFLLKSVDEAAAEIGMSRNKYIVSKLRRTLPKKNMTLVKQAADTEPNDAA